MPAGRPLDRVEGPTFAYIQRRYCGKARWQSALQNE
jgi:hypothetical protein